ncbi:MFS transporter [Kitasatospora sp. NPDC088346]|uniref:MFS transporter n=1 Tax=Kitasatospora sp. NPDC088346 TaxID=3364073 RepID=UPI0037F48A2B
MGTDADPAAVPARAATGVLAATCVSAFVVNANTSAVSILLPAISEDTDTSLATLQRAVTGYSLVGAAVIVTSGALGDIFGRRRLFIGGLLLFVASCVLIALANSGGAVIAGRAVQGAAGSTILACGPSLLSAGVSGEAQMRSVSLWGAASAAGAAAGPLLGGVLVDVTGWQGLFWIARSASTTRVRGRHRRTRWRSGSPERPSDSRCSAPSASPWRSWSGGSARPLRRRPPTTPPPAPTPYRPGPSTRTARSPRVTPFTGPGRRPVGAGPGARRCADVATAGTGPGRSSGCRRWCPTGPGRAGRAGASW